MAKKKSGKKAPRPRRPKQPMLNDDPAFERIPEIENFVEKYVAARDSRQEILRDEIELKGKLMGALKAHDLTEYNFDGYMVSLVHEEETVKVKKQRAAKEDASLA